MPPEFVVAIDGPAGAGKSTVARRVAGRLPGFRYLDTGAMYRAVTAWLLRFDKLNASGEEMAEAAGELAMEGETLSVRGTDVTGDIRSEAVTREVSRVSAQPQVRRVVQAKQRECEGRLVAEGRDIGSYVFPQAQVKIFLVAALDERARRRSRDDPALSVEEHVTSIRRRDHLDSSRDDSPLAKPDDAFEIDTTRLSIDEVVEKILTIIEDQGGVSG